MDSELLIHTALLTGTGCVVSAELSLPYHQAPKYTVSYIQTLYVIECSFFLLLEAQHLE